MSRDRVDTSGRILSVIVALLFVTFLCLLHFTGKSQPKKKSYCGDICKWVPYQPDDCQCSLDSKEEKDKIGRKAWIIILLGSLVFFVCLVYLAVYLKSCFKNENDVEASPEGDRGGFNSSFITRATAPYLVPLHFGGNEGGNFNQGFANDLPPEYQPPPAYNDVKRY